MGNPSKRIAIFRAGKHTATDGRTLEFSAADLAAIASSYNPESSEAPLVVGHPDLNAPAYGWVKSLIVEGDVLFAEAQQVDPAFAEMVNEGRFKKVSASLYLGDSPGNPTPGRVYLRHIGFLGAQPPAVKGLKSASFAAPEGAAVEFADMTPGATGKVAKLFRRLREHLIATKGTDLADSVLPNDDIADLDTDGGLSDAAATPGALALFAELSGEPWDGNAAHYDSAEAYCEACLVDENGSGPKIKAKCHLPVKGPDGKLNRRGLIAAEAALAGGRTPVNLPAAVKQTAAKKLAHLMKANGLTPSPALAKLADFSESVAATVETTMSQEAAALEERENAIKARETALAEREAKARRADAAEFAEKLVVDGKLLPRQKAPIVELLLALPAGAISFAEGSETVTQEPNVLLRAFLAELPKQVDFSEKSRDVGMAEAAVNFAAPRGVQVDTARMDILRKATAMQVKNPNMDFKSAVRAVGG